VTVGNTQNQTSREIADKQFQARLRSPSIKQKQLWHQEFLESAQYRMSWLAFLKSKTQLWRKQRRIQAIKHKRIMAAKTKKTNPAT